MNKVIVILKTGMALGIRAYKTLKESYRLEQKEDGSTWLVAPPNGDVELEVCLEDISAIALEQQSQIQIPNNGANPNLRTLRQ